MDVGYLYWLHCLPIILICKRQYRPCIEGPSWDYSWFFCSQGRLFASPLWCKWFLSTWLSFEATRSARKFDSLPLSCRVFRLRRGCIKGSDDWEVMVIYRHIVKANLSILGTGAIPWEYQKNHRSPISQSTWPNHPPSHSTPDKRSSSRSRRRQKGVHQSQSRKYDYLSIWNRDSRYRRRDWVREGLSCWLMESHDGRIRP